MSGIKFRPGTVVATPGVLEAFRASGDDPLAYLVRHIAGDWGDVDEHDARENELSLQHGWRILSAYTLNTGVKFWIITEADRSVTTFLLPHEYWTPFRTSLLTRGSSTRSGAPLYPVVVAPRQS